MDETRWKEVEEIFSRAIDLPSDLAGERRRQAVLDLCHGDEALFAEVDAMLEEDASMNPSSMEDSTRQRAR